MNQTILLHIFADVEIVAEILPLNAHNLLICTSRTRYIEKNAFGATIRSYRGASLIELFNVVNKYPALNLKSVYIVAVFNDHHYSCSHFIESYRVSLDIICYKSQPFIGLSPRKIAILNNKLVNRKLNSTKLTLQRFPQFFTVISIVSPFCSKSAFCPKCINFFSMATNCLPCIFIV